MHVTVMWAACLWKSFSDEVCSCVSNYRDIHWQLHDCKERNESHELTHMNISILYDQVAKILKFLAETHFKSILNYFEREN